MKQVTAALLGAGQRGVNAYSAYALNHPDEFKVVAVAEPRQDRRIAFAKAHDIPQENTFESWEALLEKPQMADCIMVCTQDQMHYEPVVRALKKGYHVLCEKPMSPNREELLGMEKAAQESGKLLCVCHVLRYSPFYSRIRQLLQEGAVGKLIAIQQLEGVGYWHMAHSFVRGNWRKSEDACPMIMAKCCHDMDILRYLADSPCVSVSSIGELSHFCGKNAPADAPERCTDGCPHAQSCPYYAPRFYLEHEKAVSDGFVSVLSLDGSEAGIMNALRSGQYGRCVYRCDNDVVDHQMTNMLFENGVTASLCMSAFTHNCERVVNLMGTHGQITGNMEKSEITYSNFKNGEVITEKISTGTSGHSGSDEALMQNFVETIASGKTDDCRTSASMSVESHLMALAAEHSRVHGGKAICLKDF